MYCPAVRVRAALVAAAPALVAWFLIVPTAAAAEGQPTVFEPPPPGGQVLGIAGTSDPALLAQAQPFGVESITTYMHGRTYVYWPDSPSASTLSPGLLRADSLVLLRRTPPAAPAPRPAPATAATDGHMSALQRSIEEAIAGLSGRVSVAVRDLRTGEEVMVGGDEYHLSGCVINLFVLMRAVLDVQEGSLPMERVDSLIRRTTWSSNPVTARELYAIVGGGNVLTGLERVEHLARGDLGLQRVFLNHPPGYARTADQLGRSADNWITARVMNEALAAIMLGDLFDPVHRDYLLEVLSEVTPGLNYLTAAVPAPAHVSHKNGFLHSSLGWVDNDAGIVRFQRGDETYAYAITMLFSELPARYDHLPVAREISTLAWQHFSATYP